MTQQSNVTVGRFISMLYRYSNIFLNEELKIHQIGAAQYQFLLVLFDQEGLSQDEVAEVLKVDKATAARAIAKLEAVGYVERKIYVADKRVKKLYLSEKAQQFEMQLKTILAQWNSILTKDMSDEEIELAFTLLQKMAINAEHFIE